MEQIKGHNKVLGTLVVAVILTVSLAIHHGPRPTSSCPLPAPCICDPRDTIVYCRQKNLTSIPPVTKADGQWALYLGDNHIRFLSSRHFVGLQLQMLILDNNEIENIDDDAFAGSEDTLIVLHLHYNKLTKLPMAIGNLRKIMGIMLQGNPMPAFNKNVLINVSDPLQFISFGSKEMLSWPSNLKYLPNLISIDLYDIPFSNLPDNSFSLWHKNMTFLNFYNTSLEELPSSMNNLESVTDITFEGNKNLSANSISKSINKLPGLQRITFTNNNLVTLPSIFSDSSSLYMIIVYSEPLSYFRDSTLPAHFFKHLLYIMMNDTDINAIPPSLSTIDTITRLSLTHSKITMINPEDFSGMFSLNYLFINDNPISVISDKAFVNNNRLFTISLTNSNLTSIPKAIQNIASLNSIDLTNSPIQCSCLNLGWIKSWKARPMNLQIYGDCLNIRMSLMEYISREIPKC